MKKIIRSNAVETSSLRGSLEINLYDLHPRQATIDKSSILSQTVTLSTNPKSSDIAINKTGNRSTSFQNEALSALLYLVWWSNLDFLLKAVVWVCTEKIAQVSHTQGKQIIALKVRILKLLPNIWETTQIAAKIAKTKTRLHSIQMQRKQQRSFRDSSDKWKLRELLRTGKLSGCAC
ncbi:hypothetical protein [Anabaena sp. PCC 7108]|uniref:hypothetical protein n=1 Tax=Anabaena sp. PCC 7108 TaxID=163908 RepID=UPI00034D78E6|nr:hypothetical protein [Anabaena sp. PCC 7108]